jgi:predicted negative regulator of RcsB-dependent stress response
MAIDDLLDEHEQSERVRSWLRSNALGLIGGVGLGLAGIVGWHWWQGRQQDLRMAVNTRYAQEIRAIEAKPSSAAEVKAGLQAVSKVNPTLGTLAALQLAKVQVDAGKPDDAIVTLRSLHDLDPALRTVVRERLARLLVDSGQGKDALPLLDDDRNATMLAIRGDAQMALGQRDKARAAYTKALGLMDVGDPQYRLLQFKLIEAGGTPPHTEDRA